VLTVICETADVLAVDKPAGMLVIPGRTRTEPTLVDIVSEHLRPRGQRPYVVHRLDRGTTGVVLFACTPESHRTLSMAFEHRRVEKRYVALVEGALRGEGRITLPLHTARRGHMRPARTGEAGIEAETGWKCLECFDAFTFLDVIPRTGRPHQIRVHLRAIGHPLAVDPVYGRKEPLLRRDVAGDQVTEADSVVIARTPLHCLSIKVPLPGRDPLVVRSPLPEDMKGALAALRLARV